MQIHAIKHTFTHRLGGSSTATQPVTTTSNVVSRLESCPRTHVGHMCGERQEPNLIFLPSCFLWSVFTPHFWDQTVRKCHAVTTKMNTDQSKKEKLYHSFRFLDSFTSSLHHVLLQLSGSALTWQRTGPRPSLDPPLMPQPWTCVNFGMGFHLNSLLSLPLSCAELEPPREETFDRKRVRGCFFTFFCNSQ